MLSRKPLLILILLSLCLGLVVGCDEDENLVPVLTRVQANAECGVAPLDVQFLAIASGGDQLEDPTGGNAYLNFDWNFGDGTTGNGSITSHTFEEPGMYDVVIAVTDEDDDRATLVLPIEVRADSLVVTTTPDTTVTASLTTFDVPTPRASNGDPAGRLVDTGLVINEVLVYNQTTLADNTGIFGSFIEVLNTGDETIPLLNFAITTDPFVPRMYVFGTNGDLDPGEHQLIWLDGRDLNQSEPHANFDLRFDEADPAAWPGATIYLMSPNGIPLDIMTIPAGQTPDVSFGRVYDAGINGTVELNVWADVCGFDPMSEDYSRFEFHWTVDDAVGSSYTGRSPRHTFMTEDAGTRTVHLKIYDTLQSVYRTADISVEVTAP
jgi:hypothetical protein